MGRVFLALSCMALLAAPAGAAGLERIRIGDDGALYVRTENGETALRSGEISLRLEEPTGKETQNHEDQ